MLMPHVTQVSPHPTAHSETRVAAALSAAAVAAARVRDMADTASARS